jgi:hypothetical protein
MTKTLEMVFKNTAGKETVLRLADPKDGLALAEVNTVMQKVVEKNIFQTASGELTQAVTARISSKDSVVLV